MYNVSILLGKDNEHFKKSLAASLQNLIKFLDGQFCTKLHISFIRFRFANSIIRSTGLF